MLFSLTLFIKFEGFIAILPLFASALRCTLEIVALGHDYALIGVFPLYAGATCVYLWILYILTRTSRFLPRGVFIYFAVFTQ